MNRIFHVSTVGDLHKCEPVAGGIPGGNLGIYLLLLKTHYFSFSLFFLHSHSCLKLKSDIDIFYLLQIIVVGIAALLCGYRRMGCGASSENQEAAGNEKNKVSNVNNNQNAQNGHVANGDVTQDKKKKKRHEESNNNNITTQNAKNRRDESSNKPGKQYIIS